ncbi:MAG TPA: calcium-binding protein [Tepidisphaeraceae bacterium]|jgi:hypothetical protein
MHTPHLLESLEHRQMFANAPSIAFEGRVLLVNGTDRVDAITVATGKRAVVVAVNGVEQAIRTERIERIRIMASRGDDSVILSPRLSIRASVEGGPGNDRIGGSGNDDILFGQAGNDTIVGNGGQDYLDAGPDDDYLVDTDRADYGVLHGGGGDDRATLAFGKYGSGVERVLNESEFFGIFIRQARLSDDGEKLQLFVTEQVQDRSDVDFFGGLNSDDQGYRAIFRFNETGDGVNDVLKFGTFDVTSARGQPVYYYRLFGADDMPLNVKPIVLFLKV